MRILIQEMKTIKRTVTENKQFSKENTNIKDSTNHERQTKRTQRPSLLKWPLLLGTKPEKNNRGQLQEHKPPQLKIDLRLWKLWKRRMRSHI